MFTLASSLWLRRFIAAARLATIETAPDRAVGWPDHFDNTAGIGPIQRPLFYKDKRSGILLPYKGRAAPLAVEEKIGIEAHITAIAFGVTDKAIRFWMKQLRSGLIPQDVVAFYARGFELSDPDYLRKVAERMALHQRFWKVPYHFVGLLNGDVLHNNLITRYTHHGNGGNRPLVGVSLEGHYPGLERNRKKKHNGYDEHTILTGRAALSLAVIHSREEGAPIEALYAHRQYSKNRVGDPGEGWWREIGVPVAEELHLERRVTFTHGSGLQVCQEWDDLGLVDYRGRKLAA
jgi:hypothetical protein